MLQRPPYITVHSTATVKAVLPSGNVRVDSGPVTTAVTATGTTREEALAQLRAFSRELSAALAEAGAYEAYEAE